MQTLQFCLDTDVESDKYSFKAKKWYPAGGNFLSKPTELAVTEWVNKQANGVKITFKLV